MHWRLSAALALPAIAVACGGTPPPQPPPADTTPSVQVVSASILTNGCASFGPVNGRLAAEAMHKLVEGCTSVPGGSTRFTVTLQPGGRIELPQGEGQPATIPTCVLKNELRHKVYLQKPCSLEVKLGESSVDLPAAPGTDGGANDGAADAR